MSTPLDAAGFIAQCADATAERAGPLLAAYEQALAAVVAPAEQGPHHLALRQAAIPLVNLLVKCGLLVPCLQLVRKVRALMPVPELQRIHGELARHVSGQLARQSAEQVHQLTGQFMSVVLRPVRAQDHALTADAPMPKGLVIVMQGPLLQDNQFTLDTLRLYARMYPGVPLVLSTWEGESVAALHEAQIPGLHIVTSARPANPGPVNVNMQITSARAGVVHAVQALGATHVFKTRTDMRLYNPNAMLDMMSLLAHFPAGPATGQQARLVLISDVVRYLHHAVPDKHMLGTAADMLAFWGAPLDERPSDALPAQPSIREHARQMLAEQYLLHHYLQKLNWPMRDTLADHFQVLADLFVVYDRSAADVYWPKYNQHLEYRFKHHGHTQMLEEFGFNDWLRLQGRYRPVMPEGILDLPQGMALDGLLAQAVADSAEADQAAELGA